MTRQRLKDFYDNLYKQNPHIFGDSSTKFLTQIESEFISSNKRVLDMGTGEGLSALYLAKKGFFVEAIDLSSEAFSAIQNQKNIEIYRKSIEEFNPVHDYGLILFSLITHHVKTGMFSEKVKTLQKHTSDKGIHSYRIFTINSDFYKNFSNDTFFDDGENLNVLYDGWDIVHDQLTLSHAATVEATNEIREVAFRKN